MRTKLTCFHYTVIKLYLHIGGDKPVYITDGENVLMNKPDEDCSALLPSCHGEADTCMFVYITDTIIKR